MNYKTKAFEVNAQNIAYYLDLPLNVDVHSWTVRHDENVIRWYNNIIHGDEGIKGIIPICESILVRFHWSIWLDDITWTQGAMLKHRYDAYEASDENIEGEFMIYTITTKDKDWDIDFNIEFNGSLKPQEVNFNFLNRKIEVK